MTGSHVCQLYRDRREHKAFTLPFLKAGLDAGDCCFLVVAGSDDSTVERWYFELKAAGVDVRGMRESGALQVVGDEDRREFRNANSIVKARMVWQFLEANLARFQRVRVASDVTWTLDPPVPVEELSHWEATFDFLTEGVAVTSVCQYDLTRHTPATIHSALRTHRQVVLEGASYANPYFEAQRILAEEPGLNGTNVVPADVEKMLARVKAT
jgi:hypothetical protein